MNRFWYLLILLGPLHHLNAQKPIPTSSVFELDSMIKVIRETYEVPGLAVEVIKNNKILYSNTIGVQDLDSSAPLTKTSVFHMASVSKPFVATAIMQLVEAGKMNLDDKLINYLPYFKMKDKRYSKITIKQILNHSSGIPDVEDYEWDNPQFDDGAAERYSRSFSEIMLDFKPGKNYSYSNASFNILADVISKVTGMTFEAYMEKNIFKPAGMINSTFYKPNVPNELVSKPHGLGKDLQMEVMEDYPYNRIHAPSSTLHSNIEDMNKWAMLYMNKGRINGKQIFSEATYDLLTTATNKVNDQIDMCLSWFRQELSDGKVIYYHSGGDEGFRTFFGFMPEEKAAIILMGNNDYFQTRPTVGFLIRNQLMNESNQWKKYLHFELKNLILTEGIDSCKSFYDHLKENYYDQYDFENSNLDQLGYWLLDRKKNQEALDIFLFNIELFPGESGFYDSVGDAYAAMKDEPKAIEWYEKAIELNPKQDYTIHKLEKLKTDGNK